MIHIAPSILACDFSRLGDEVRAVEVAGADVIHLDVMDGHFVPNISFGVPVIASLRTVTKLPFDCHLMIGDPAQYIESFARSGADWISVHIETCNPSIVLPAIQRLGCRAGLVLNPATPVDAVIPHLRLADYVLVMSVQPGFAGQRFLPIAIEKIRALKTHLAAIAHAIPLEIDGGITLANAREAIAAGADILVAGNTIFKSGDYAATIRQLRSS